MTRAEIKQLLTNEMGQEQADLLNDEYLNRIIDLCIKQIQSDLQRIGNKYFTKTHYFTNYLFVLPNDFMGVPNTVVSLKASVGTPGTNNIETDAGNFLKLTLREPSTTGWVVYFIPAGSPSISFDLATNPKSLTIYYKSMVTTHLQIIDLLAGTPEFAYHFVPATTDSPSGVCNPTFLALGFTLTGTSSGYLPAKEISIEELDRLYTSIFKVPSDQKLYYTVITNESNEKYIQIFPNKKMYGQLSYFYLLEKVTDDITDIGIPELYFPAFYSLLKMTALDKIRANNHDQSKEAEYRTNYETLKRSYQESITGYQQDKTTLKVEEPA